jgi:PIN domain nuclease of toxin-antitoxin system
MTDNSLVNEGTDPVENSANQVASKTFTQEEVNAILARTKTQLEKKYASKYEDLGDPDELRQLRVEAEKRQQEQQIKRGEFDRTLQELAAKKDQEIQKRDNIIREYRVKTPVLNAAAQYRAVNPDQVRTLLQPNLRLNDDGEVEVIDAKGAVRYNDAGMPIGVEDLVREFLDSNPHFVAPTPATTNTQTSVNGRGGNSLDVAKLDFKKPEHRKLYAEAKKAGRV